MYGKRGSVKATEMIDARYTPHIQWQGCRLAYPLQIVVTISMLDSAGYVAVSVVLLPLLGFSSQVGKLL
jgi:hypothetical protein